MGAAAEPTPEDLGDVDLTDLDRFTHGFPHETFARLRRVAPVWWHPPTEHTPDGEGFWVVSRYAEVAAAAADGETYSSDGSHVRASGGGGTLIEDLPGGFGAGVLLNMMDDPRHQRIRKVVTPAVSPRALARFEPELRRRTEAIVDDAVARGTCDFLVDVAAELPLQAIVRLLGVPEEDRHQLFRWAEVTLDHDDHDPPAARAARQQEASAAMFAYGSALLEEKRRRPAHLGGGEGTKDLLAAIVGAELPTTGLPGGSEDAVGPMTELEQQMFFNLLIAAGSETTRNSIAIGLLGLMAFPDQWAAVRADRSLLPGLVEEVLRYASSTTYNRRTATRDTELGGVAIATGDKVTLWWGSANHDEAVFPDPSRFDVTRSPNRHLAFGHGGHFCLGAGLARLEIRLVYEVLLERVEAVEPAGEPEWTRSNKHTGLRHLPVILRAVSSPFS